MGCNLFPIKIQRQFQCNLNHFNLPSCLLPQAKEISLTNRQVDFSTFQHQHPLPQFTSTHIPHALYTHLHIALSAARLVEVCSVGRGVLFILQPQLLVTCILILKIYIRTAESQAGRTSRATQASRATQVVEGRHNRWQRKHNAHK